MKKRSLVRRAARRNPAKGCGVIGMGGFKNAADAATKLLAKYGKGALGYARDYYTVATRDVDKKFWTVVYGFIYDEVAGVQTNPKLGNSGWEFKQRKYSEMLSDALDIQNGKRPSADQLHDLVEDQFKRVKHAIQQNEGRIISVKDYSSLRAAVTLSLAKLVLSGEMTPGPHLRRNPRRPGRNPFWLIPGSKRVVFAHTKPHPKAVRVSRYFGGRPRKNLPRGIKTRR